MGFRGNAIRKKDRRPRQALVGPTDIGETPAGISVPGRTTPT